MGAADGESSKDSHESACRTVVLFEQRFTGMRRMELANAKSRSKAPRRSNKSVKQPRFVLCVKEMDGVEKGRVYKVLPDPFARQHKLIRIVDDSEEDYLFPAHNFVAVTSPRSAEKHLERRQPGPPRQKRA